MLESFRLSFVVAILVFEFILRHVVTFALYVFPVKPVLLFIRGIPGRIISAFTNGSSNDLAVITSAAEILASVGIAVEEFSVETEDGFHLVLHRLCHSDENPKTENVPVVLKEMFSAANSDICFVKDVAPQPPNGNLSYSSNVSRESDFDPSGEPVCLRPPVLMFHGLMMSSEVFICNPHISLAIFLFYQGYDIWLGNNRGNKYSWRHRDYKRNDTRYWDFSIDEFSHFDVPASVDKVLAVTRWQSLIYIGFSNGTAQMFAALATQKDLNRKLSVFVSLAPACKLQSLNPDAEHSLALFYPLICSSRTFFYLIFGKNIILSAADFWKKWLTRKAFAQIIDACLHVLFSWHPKHAEVEDKERFYCHIYSTTSVKVVHHWFQMLKSGRFEYYDNNAGLGVPGDIIVPEYHVSQIKTPIILLHGGCDKLSNIGWLKRQLKTCHAIEVPHYEHIDFLIAKDLPNQVFPHILRALEQHPPCRPLSRKMSVSSCE
uniref:Partial AB-hydrolase lipase domain-containing protein n=1 Tax=Lankesteria abbotti TaxID=340204 RepID=A0A6T5UG70_9APIC|mmetsp:Transcript_2197/g.2613  ORF Transcript_2197/g.2613 Transcript_2197/m.2613 type:complete len:489 (+) Transcript_2197:43-1509(+)